MNNLLINPKNNRKKRLFPLVLLLSTLTGCTGIKPLCLYNNADTLTDGTLTIRYQKSDEYEDRRNGPIIRFQFILHFLSKSTKKVSIKSKSAIIYREKDKAEYDVSCPYFLFGNTLELECDIEKEVVFNTSLPSMTKDDNYYMVFRFNSKELRCYFYDDISIKSKYSDL